jgi:putative transposase
MARRRHTREQIVRKLAEGQKLLAGGMDVEGVCRQFGIAESTWARWLNQYGGMKADDARRLRELEGENARLKLLSPNRKRAAVTMLQDRFGVSERRACRVVGQHRSTQRLEPPTPPDDEAGLRDFLRMFAKRRPRWGWRRAAKGAAP